LRSLVNTFFGAAIFPDAFCGYYATSFCSAGHWIIDQDWFPWLCRTSPLSTSPGLTVANIHSDAPKAIFFDDLAR